MTRRFTVLAVAALLATGCSYKNATIPGAPIPFAKADYTILGNTNAEDCGTYILLIDWAHLFSNDSAAIAGGATDPISAVLGLLLGQFSPEAGRALYMALEKIPEATHLLSPRIHTSTSGLTLGPGGRPIFGQRCAMVDARGVLIGERPIPAAQVQ